MMFSRNSLGFDLQGCPRCQLTRHPAAATDRITRGLAASSSSDTRCSSTGLLLCCYCSLLSLPCSRRHVCRCASLRFAERRRASDVRRKGPKEWAFVKGKDAAGKENTYMYLDAKKGAGRIGTSSPNSWARGQPLTSSLTLLHPAVHALCDRDVVLGRQPAHHWRVLKNQRGVRPSFVVCMFVHCEGALSHCLLSAPITRYDCKRYVKPRPSCAEMERWAGRATNPKPLPLRTWEIPSRHICIQYLCLSFAGAPTAQLKSAEDTAARHARGRKGPQGSSLSLNTVWLNTNTKHPRSAPQCGRYSVCNLRRGQALAEISEIFCYTELT